MIDGSYVIGTGNVWQKAVGTSGSLLPSSISATFTSSSTGITFNGAPQFPGLVISNSNNFALLDTQISISTTFPASATYGQSVYGLVLQSCSNYLISRSTFNTKNGNAGSGHTGANGANGANGAKGNNANCGGNCPTPGQGGSNTNSPTPSGTCGQTGTSGGSQSGTTGGWEKVFFFNIFDRFSNRLGRRWR